GGELAGLDASTLGAATSELPRGDVSATQLSDGLPVADACVTAGIVKSKGEARRAIRDGGACVNNDTVPVAAQARSAAGVLAAEAGGEIIQRREEKTLGAVDIVG